MSLLLKLIVVQNYTVSYVINLACSFVLNCSVCVCGGGGGGGGVIFRFGPFSVAKNTTFKRDFLYNEMNDKIVFL